MSTGNCSCVTGTSAIHGDRTAFTQKVSLNVVNNSNNFMALRSTLSGQLRILGSCSAPACKGKIDNQHDSSNRNAYPQFYQQNTKVLSRNLGASQDTVIKVVGT